MTVTFSEACERDIKAAKHVRVAVYPEVKDWLPVQVRLEVSDCPRQLGATSAAHRDFMKSTLMVVVMIGLAVYLAANVSMGVK